MRREDERFSSFLRIVLCKNKCIDGVCRKHDREYDPYRVDCFVRTFSKQFCEQRLQQIEEDHSADAEADAWI